VYGCAVTERFALKTKYFYDEQNLKAFREEYAAMPLHEKAMENRLLAGGSGRGASGGYCPARGWRHHLSLYSNM